MNRVMGDRCAEAASCSEAEDPVSGSIKDLGCV